MVVLNTDELFRYCIKNKKTLTPTRILIIRILSKFSKPQSAYDLLKEVNKEINPDLNISTIYRVLDFWMGIGLIHKISAINKYLVCLTPNEKHTHMLNFCTVCEKVNMKKFECRGDIKEACNTSSWCFAGNNGF